LFFYADGSVSTKQTAFKDSAGNTAWTNPLVLDSGGNLPSGGQVWFTAGQTYKVVFAPSNETDPPASPYRTLIGLAGINDTTSAQSEWVAGPTPQFVAPTQFTLVGDQTPNFQVGRRIRTANTGGTIYSTIQSSVFGVVTTVTVVNDSGSLDSGLNAVSYALLAATNPSLPIRGVVSPAQITVNTNDLTVASIANASSLRISTDARRNITGLAGGVDGKTLKVHNVGTFPAVFTYQDTGSAAANRFAFGMTLGGGQSMEIQYDATTARWRGTSLPDPLGMLKDFGVGTVPAGYLACDATAVSRTTFAALFNEVGTTWGAGDGSTTFNVPDSRRRAWVGSGGSGTATIGNAIGNTGGEEGHSLTSGENGTHPHGLAVFSGAGDGSEANTGVPAKTSSGGQNLWAAGGNQTNNVPVVANSGSGTAHNTIQPSAITTKLIKYA
jgi:microcystin-dependent protein